MRYAVLADIHSNLTAFVAVLEDIEKKGGASEIWCLGDVVGYGPDPHECIELLRQHFHCGVAGNHDWAAAGKIDTTDFNPTAAAAAQWTASQLTQEDIEYLSGLPLVLRRDDFTLVHGSPRDPIWEYLTGIQDAKANFPFFESRYCLVGHSHIPLLFEYVDRLGICSYSQLSPELSLRSARGRLIINPGGVGQPRDGDPRAGYALIDTDKGIIYHYRIDYDIAATQKRMTSLGLPTPLITRLTQGR